MAKAKIMVLDDNQDFSETLRAFLVRNGYEVVLAQDGIEGLEVAQNEKPALILVDIKMPRMDGYTFIREFKKKRDSVGVHVVVLTSYEPMKEMFELEGIRDYFVKTVELESLLQKIEQKLG